MNAVERMVAYNLQGVELIVMNTDAGLKTKPARLKFILVVKLRAAWEQVLDQKKRKQPWKTEKN